MEEIELIDILGEYSAQEPFVWSLVLHSAKIPHSLVRDNKGWMLRVEDGFVDQARREIIAFEAENKDWPPPKEQDGGHWLGYAAGEPPTILVMGALLIFYAFTGPVDMLNPWFNYGGVMASRVLANGEWWRLVSGLTLHANPGHVLGNVLIGGVLVHFLCRQLGAGFGLALILFSGAVGNGLNVLFRGAGHNSIGFSTAVFGAVGILCGLQISGGRGLRGLLLPLGAALGLLGFLGTSGAHTDLGAHFWGAVVGLFIGFLVIKSPPVKKLISNGYWQFLCFMGAVGIIWWAWSKSGAFAVLSAR